MQKLHGPVLAKSMRISHYHFVKTDLKQRWRQVEEIFHQAAELSPAERPAFLANFSDEPGLVAEVESLLLFSSPDHRTLESAVKNAVSALPPELTGPDDLAGQRAGAYRLLQPLGRGGMGFVYLAERADAEFEKKVAIKFIAHGSLDAEAVLLFKREREILARLEHPNVARLLDSGAFVSPSGGPAMQYIVMELVDGVPLDNYVARHKLPLSEILQLFKSVCSAVQYAHQNLIVHRDLKPSNILVDEKSCAKLLDFGIARVLDRGGEASLLVGSQALTPNFASPEQVRGENAGVASDVYSLGVILYQLLSGEKPYDVSTGSPLAWAAAICEMEPLKPSEKTRTIAGNLLKGDLDTIVMKALRKEPRERFASVQQFSDDIQRYLEGRPISARPATWAYRSAKFVRRNRVLLTTAAVTLAVLIGGFASTMYQSRVAQRRFELVHRLTTRLLFDFYGKIENLPGATAARQQVVGTAQEYLDALSREASGDPNLQLELADAYLKIGDVQGNSNAANLGHFDAALASYRQALKVAEAAMNTAGVYVRARGLQVAAKIRLAQVELNTGSYALANPHFKAALDDALALEKLPGGASIAAMHLLDARAGLANTFWRLSQSERALPLLEENRKQWERIAAAQGSAQNRLALAQCLQMIGNAYRDVGQLQPAARHLEESTALAEQLLKESPHNAKAVYLLANDYMQLSIIYGRPGVANLNKTEAAFESLYKWRKLVTEAAVADAEDARLPYQAALTYSYEATMLVPKDPKKAVVLFEKALDGYAALPKEMKAQVRTQEQEIEDRAQIATPLDMAGRVDQALGSLKKAYQDSQELIAGHPELTDTIANMVSMLENIGQLYDEKHDYAKAEESLQEATKLGLQLVKGSPSSEPYSGILAAAYATFSGVLAKAGERNRACEIWTKGLEEKKRWRDKSTELAADFEQYQKSSKVCER